MNEMEIVIKVRFCYLVYDLRLKLLVINIIKCIKQRFYIIFL